MNIRRRPAHAPEDIVQFSTLSWICLYPPPPFSRKVFIAPFEACWVDAPSLLFPSQKLVCHSERVTGKVRAVFWIHSRLNLGPSLCGKLCHFDNSFCEAACFLSLRASTSKFVESAL